jgi:hypothetical protein
MVVCTGGMSVDPDDKTPKAIKESGAGSSATELPSSPAPCSSFPTSFGSGPGIARMRHVCQTDDIRSDASSVLARTVITADDIAALGNGGLLPGCKVCVFPDCAFGKGGV